MKLKEGAARYKEMFTAPSEFKTVGDDGTFSGYASIFGNVDLGGDVVERGAFSRGDMELTKDGAVRIADSHNLRVIIGKAMVEQDDTGLKFSGQLILGLQAARDAHLRMKAGVLDGMSIGYDSLEDEMTTAGVRKLKRLKLYEISPVTFGMNPLARIESVKSRQITTIREFEDFLREEAGFSNAQAKLLASGGWKSLQKARDETGEDDAATVQDTVSYLKTLSLSI
jgi:HK97 family phage prohead protease